MRIIYVIVLFFSTIHILYAQEVGSFTIEYNYQHHAHVPNHPGIPARLYVGNDFTLYILLSSQRKAQVIQISDSVTQNIRKGTYDKYTAKIQHIIFEEKAWNRKGIIVEDSIDLQWTLIPENKREILGLTCFSATTTFRGRKYTAWYAPEIPIPSGPWKFYGLPGLILEAKSEDGRFSFEATSLSNQFDKDLDEKYRKVYNLLLTSEKWDRWDREDYVKAWYESNEKGAKAWRSSMKGAENNSLSVVSIEKDLSYNSDL